MAGAVEFELLVLTGLALDVEVDVAVVLEVDVDVLLLIAPVVALVVEVDLAGALEVDVDVLLLPPVLAFDVEVDVDVLLLAIFEGFSVFFGGDVRGGAVSGSTNFTPITSAYFTTGFVWGTVLVRLAIDPFFSSICAEVSSPEENQINLLVDDTISAPRVSCSF